VLQLPKLWPCLGQVQATPSMFVVRWWRPLIGKINRPSCCSCTLVEGEKSHPASYWGCSHERGELQRRRAQRAHKESSGRTFFSKFNSPEQSYTAALRQDTQHQQPQAPQTYEEGLRTPVQQHLPQQDIQKTGLLIQAHSSSNSDILKVATVVH
jgi:hypothetical protein